ILDGFLIRTVVVPVLGPESKKKAKIIAGLAKTDAGKALDAFVENSYDTDIEPETRAPGLDYNILLTRALSINKVPYIVNAQGLVHTGMPEELHLFLLKK
ncbi:MAG: hypothetical protein LC657_04700, partial [Desulfobacteraceae bacterium]|nr:hypothetical protein [Desulfobacteraceae bacterium]